VHNRGLLANATQSLRPLEELIVNDQSRSHMHKYARMMHISQCRKQALKVGDPTTNGFRERDHLRTARGEYSVQPMDALFKILGVLLACYVIQALRTGAVYAKSRGWGRTYMRVDDPFGYWSAIGAYGMLSLALVFVF
jgi:hypothetical protein